MDRWDTEHLFHRIWHANKPLAQKLVRTVGFCWQDRWEIYHLCQLALWLAIQETGNTEVFHPLRNTVWYRRFLDLVGEWRGQTKGAFVVSSKAARSPSKLAPVDSLDAILERCDAVGARRTLEHGAMRYPRELAYEDGSFNETDLLVSLQSVLDSRLMELIYLRFFLDYSTKECAQRLGVSEARVSQLIQKALACIARQVYGADEFPNEVLR